MNEHARLFYAWDDKNPIFDLQLVGYHSIRLALENPKRKIHRLYYNAGSDSGRITEIINLSKDQGVDSKPTTRGFLNQFACSTLHRGVCADAEPLCPESGDRLTDELNIENIHAERLWLLLCSVGDPFNLGAIIRSAYFLGVERIFLCSPHDSEQASSPLNAVASRTSAGILEIFTPKFIHRPEAFLEKLQDNGTYFLNPKKLEPFCCMKCKKESQPRNWFGE